MSATRGVGVEGIHLAHVRCNGMEPRGTGDHLGRHSSLSVVHAARNAPEETWVVVCGGAKNVPLLVQPDPPSVVVVLMKKFHLRPIRLEAEGAGTEVVPLPVYFPVEARIADRSVNPIVQPVTQVARASVSIPRPKAREKNLLKVRPVVTIRIL